MLPHPIEHLAERGRHDARAAPRARPDRPLRPAVDDAFDVLRGNPVADRLFYAATELGDFGLIWVLLAWAHGLRSERDLRHRRSS